MNRMWRCALMVCFWPVLPAPCLAEPEETVVDVQKILQPEFEAAPIISSSRRFMVTGHSSAGNMQLALWAEKAAERFQRLVGGLPVLKPSLPLHIRVKPDPSLQPRVFRHQAIEGRFFSQKLVIVQPGRVDQEDVLEGLCWLLLNQKVYALQLRDGKKKKELECPDWLSVGIAQNLFPELKQRNHKRFIKAWREGKVMPLREILTLEYLPYGRWSEKIWCGILVDWLRHGKNGQANLNRIVSEIARGALVGEGRVMSLTAADEPPGTKPEHAWRRWLERRLKSRIIWGSVDQDDIDALKEITRIGPERWDDVVRELPYSGVNFQRLLNLKDQGWMPELIGRLREDLRLYAIGKPQDYQRVAKTYLDFLDRLEEARGKKKSYKKALEQLRLADKALIDYEKHFVRSKEYLDEVMRSWRTRQEASPAIPPVADSPARAKFLTDLKVYMDTIESIYKDIDAAHEMRRK